GIAIVCGELSGNLEVMDFDSPELIEEWRELVNEASPGLLALLPQVETPGGGLHVLYRCKEIGGNQKLASRLESGKAHTMIETRGRGGYVLAAGSPPGCHPTGKIYRLINGDLASIPEISLEEREILFTCARSFNAHVKTAREIAPERNHKAEDLKPGEDFN